MSKMNFDVEKILTDEYLDSFLSQIVNKITEFNGRLVKTYSFDEIVSMSNEEISILFDRYGVSTSEIMKHKNSSFSMLSAYSDLFPMSNTRSMEKYELTKRNVQLSINELNSKIDLSNAKIREDVSKLTDISNLVKVIAGIIKKDEVLLEDEIVNLREHIIKSNLSDSQKFSLSYILSKYLISKNISLLSRTTIVKKDEVVDTDEFESALTDVYEDVEYSHKETNDEIKGEVKESKYIDTIVKYYKKYEELFKNSGLGDNLEEILFTAQSISADISISNGSISKDDFSIQMASLLYILKTIDYDNDIVASALEELDDMDKLYDEFIHISNANNNLLEQIKDTVNLMKSKALNSDMKEVVEFLEELMLELRKHIITEERRKSIEEEYNSLCNQFLNLQDKEKILFNLENLKMMVEDRLSSSSYSSNTSNDFEKMANLQNSLDEMIDLVKKNGINEELLETIKNITYEIENFDKGLNPGAIGDKTTLKGFVLFDFDENNVPYVVSDLDPNSKRNLIDKSIEPRKLVAGYKSYDKLISDLLLLGEPEKLVYNDSQGFNTDRISSPLYNGTLSRTQKFTTGMYKIRPQRNGVARFIEQKVVLYPNTEVYNQVTGIIKEILPNVDFVDDENLQLYINFASLMKRSDESGHKEAMKRYDRQSSLYKLFISDNKDRLTDKECDLLREIVKMTLNAYSDLSSKNPLLEFGIIEKIGGKKNRGL